MRRLAFSLLTVLLLAACAGAPQKTSSRAGGSIVVANGAYHAPPPGFPNFVDHSIGREEISIQAMGLVGIPYRWGGNTPDSGFDCSGLVRYVLLRAASVNLPRTTADMSGRGESVEPNEIAPGDLVFFNTTGRAHSHVGIYVGKLRFVNAPSTGGTVRLDYLTNPYWAKRFDGIRRMAAPAATPAPFDTPVYQAAAPQPVIVPTVPTVPQGPALAAASATGSVGNTSVQADSFEPPPPALTAAQQQAREAGAVAPTVVPARTLDYSVATAPVQPSATTARAPALPAAVARAPDPIDAAADAFEPPPPSASLAERQARQARQAQAADSTDSGVQIMRASTASRGMPAPTQTTDDPIARFANGNF
ncbi:C40 family peptidase [Paraburkholderia sp. BCC1886]|uniref:C40 family peptidase n=1 Tax=Paraburkholderia sp. BCC1886 TaxID=2562670 RepID=UPI001183EA85|nr:C40 family peptidase [Paraburkholderia sp. BCC1886]